MAFGSKETRTTHESFGNIQVSRPSGHVKLFQSPHRHQHFISIQIRHTELVRDLSRDWTFSRGLPLIEINMSEAQWANFVSSAGIGEGTSCTIVSKTDGNYYRCEPVPETENIRSTFEKEALADAKGAMEGMKKAMDALMELVEKGKAGKKELTEVKSMLDMAYRDGTSSFAFVMKQFENRIDTLVMEAKTEVEAYGLNTIRSIGLAAIAQNISPEDQKKMIDSLVAPALQGIEDKTSEKE